MSLEVALVGAEKFENEKKLEGVELETSELARFCCSLLLISARG